MGRVRRSKPRTQPTLLTVLKVMLCRTHNPKVKFLMSNSNEKNIKSKEEIPEVYRILFEKIVDQSNKKGYKKLDRKIKTSEFRSILSWKIALGSGSWFKIGKELERYGLVEFSKRYVKIKGNGVSK